MAHICRWGWLCLLCLLAACDGAARQATQTPTLVIATPAPNIVTIAPTRDPRLSGESVIAQDLGPIGSDARPRLAIDREGALHMLWLARSGTGGSALIYRRWMAEANWFDAETWATWKTGAPLQWALAVDDANVPNVVWSEPGRLFFARRDNPVSRIEYELEFDVAGQSITQDYATCFGFTAWGNELYVLYRDDAPWPPNLRLAYSPFSGKDWTQLEAVMPDPGEPSMVYDIGMTAGADGALHLILGAPDNQIYVQRRPGEETWQGLVTSRDIFEDGELGRDVAVDAQGAPHLLLNKQGRVYYYFWDGAAWHGAGQPLLQARRGKPVMSLGLTPAPDGLAWVLGDGVFEDEFANPPPGLWLRTFNFKGRDASASWLVQRGSLTEAVIAVGATYTHIAAVLDGHLWHIRVDTSMGAALPRQRLEATPAPGDQSQG
ncbi:MAG: hypothetical protein JXB47_08125 [Anaerolineae bacterium]|nr:hypothetical protein [Anaerolineae bacterium]